MAISLLDGLNGNWRMNLSGQIAGGLIGASLALFSYQGQAADLPEPLEKQLHQLVELDSGTSNLTGVLGVQNWIEAELKSLGFSVELGPNHLLSATRAGDLSKVVTFIVHADTVFEHPSPFQIHTSSEGARLATGPGVIDNKGGIVVAIAGLRRYLKEKSPKVSLKFVSSPSEETGSPGLLDLYRKWAKDSWMVLGFEPALDDGSLIESRRGDRWYHITAIGKEAHAGRAHKDGINACFALASKISQISRLTDYKKDVTVSIGRMEGGKDKYNIVCGEAQAKVDVRFSNLSERDRVHARILKILNQEEISGAAIKFELTDDCPPFTPSRNAKQFLQRYISIIRTLEGHEIFGRQSGGAADSNYFSNKDAIIIDGLGPIGGKMHTKEEFIILASLATRAEALHRFLSSLK